MFTIGLLFHTKEPIYEQIYKYIRDEIKSGSLSLSTKLPSSRGLAKHLSISRNTVDMAYAQLVSEGYIESFPKKGFFVCQMENTIISTPLEDDAKEDSTSDELEYKIDFSPNGVDMVNFPYNRWRRLTKEAMMDDNSQLFQSGHPQGDMEFRLAIRLYLHQSRGVNCNENQILIGAGSDYLLLILAQLLGKDKIIALEDPTYPQAYRIFHSLGYQTKSIPLDNQGMDVTVLRETGADICYVTPSHQYPIGVVMPINRRMQLLTWANEEEGRFIIEDDYDSEFRYQGKPIPSLQSSDTKGKVIYIGTFSKAIAPAIRVSYMVLPQKLLKAYKEYLSFYSCTVSRIDQTVIHRFITEGYYERHLNKMRGIYKGKHDCLVAQLKEFGSDITIFGESAGLHLLIEYNKDISQNELIERAARSGIKVYPLTDYYIEGIHLNKPIIILGFARLSEETIKKGISILKDIW